MAFIARMHVVPFFPEYMVKYNLGYAEVGLLLSVFYLAYGLVLVPVGMLADRLSARMLFAWGWIVTGLGIAGSAFSPSYEILLATRALTALGVSMMYPPGVKLITLTFEQNERGKAIGMAEIGVGIGMLVSMTFFPALAGWLAFTSLFAAAAIACLPIAVVSFTMADPQTTARTAAPTGEPASQGQEDRGLLLLKPFWYLVTATTLFYFVMNGMLGWIPTYLEFSGFTKAKAGVITGIINLGQVLSSLPAGGLSDRIGRRTPVIQVGAVMLGAIPAGFLLGGAESLPLLILIIIGAITGVGMGFGIAPSATLAAEMFGQQRSATVTSSTAAAGQVGSALAGALFGWIVDITNSFQYVWIVSLVALAGRIILMELVGEPRHRPALASRARLGR